MQLNKLFILVLSFFFITGSSSLFAQINQTDAQGRKQGLWSKRWKESGAIRYKGHFKNDKPIGKFVYYFPTGQVRCIMIHDKDSDRALAYYYFENKKVASYGIYHGEKKDSVWTNFYRDGTISSKETFKNGKKNGLKTIYYRKGVSSIPNQSLVLKKLHFKNGVADGSFTSFFPTGRKKSEGQYKDGALYGIVKKYHPNGNIRLLERYEYGGKRNGWWIAYDSSGEETGRRYFKHGKSLEGKKLKAYMEKLKAEGVNPNDPNMYNKHH